MRRIAFLAVVGAMAAAGWAQAQVAVPELVPGGFRIVDSRFPIAPIGSMVPANPGALQWGAPSRISLGALRGHKLDQVDGNSLSYDGSYAGLRWIRPRVALAAESLDFAVDFPGVAPAPHVEKRQGSLALSFSWPDSLAWGISSTSHAYQTVSPGPVLETLDGESWTAGLSWRLGESFFLGAGFGKDEGQLTGAFVGTVTRDHNMVGIGLRGGGALVWHLEADLFHRDDYKDNAGAVQKPGYDLTLVTAEGIWGNWLLTYSVHDATANAVPDAFKGYVIDFGYAPLTGLTVTWRSEHSKHTGLGGAEVSAESADSIAISWGF